MEIEKIELYGVQMPLACPFRTSFGVTSSRHVILVRVIERGGEEGWGEVVAGEGPWYSYETYETALYVLDKFLIKNVLNCEDVSKNNVWAVMSRVKGHNMAKAALEMAVWDLEARLASQPLSRFIGGVRSRIESGVSIGIAGSVSELLKIIGTRLDEGYLRIKLKIEPGWDVDVLLRVRREYPDIPLQVDANAAYRLRDLKTLLKLDEFDLLMLEQPFEHDNLDGHAILSRKLRTPICLDESITSLNALKTAYKLGAVEVVNLKPGRVGGYTEGLAIYRFAVDVGLGFWIGGMLETGIGRGHLVALASLPGVSYPNDISASSRYWKEDIVEPPWVQKNGYINVPNKPGIGVEVKWEALKKYLEWRREYRKTRT